jgi:hypothetical protein
MTKLSDKDLSIYLEKIRRIARMDDYDAMAEIDELAFNLAQRGVIESMTDPEENDFELEVAEDELREFKRELKQYRGKVTRNDVSEWEIHDLQEQADSLGEWSDTKIYQKLHQKASTLKEETISLIKDLWMAYGRGKLAEFDQEFKRMSASAQRGLERWNLEGIVRLGEELGSDWVNDEAKAALANDIQQRKDSARAKADGLFCQKAAEEIQDSKKVILHNVNSTRRLMEDLSEAEEVLTSHSRLTEKLKDDIRQERIRCAFFRAQKKLLAAEVASKMGEGKKSSKLKLEAVALLEQDWACVFPDGPIPDISSVPGA